jgi:hypothetical protein
MKNLINYIIRKYFAKMVTYEIFETREYEIRDAVYEHLQPEDIRKNFSINYKLYQSVLEAKNTNSNHNSYDVRTGYYIDGSKINTRFHELHEYNVLDKKTKIIYLIDTVTYMYNYGQYISLTVREDGSKSHNSIDYKNINSRSKMILDIDKDFDNQYQLIKK